MQNNITEKPILVNNVKEWEPALSQLQKHMRNTRVVGFDCEWVEVNNWRRLYEKGDRGKRRYSYSSSGSTENGFPPQQSTDEKLQDSTRLANTLNDKVSLVQISAVDGFTILIRTILFKTLPLSLKHFLEDSNIIKVGVNIYADCSRLHRDWNVIVNSYLDIRFLVKDFPQTNMQEPYRNGLKALGRTFCDDTKDFEQKMRFSNWCDIQLNPDQIKYASQDAQIAAITYGNLGKGYLNATGEFSYGQKLVDEPVIFWTKWNHTCRVYLNCKFDQDKFMSLKMGGQGSGKRKKGREEADDSDSDLDLDLSHLAIATMDTDKIVELSRFGSSQTEDLESGEVAEINLAAHSAMLPSTVGRKNYRTATMTNDDPLKSIKIGNRYFKIRVCRSRKPLK